MKVSALSLPLVLFALLGLVSADAFGNNKVPKPKKRTGMTKQEIKSIVSQAPEVQSARRRVASTKKAMNDLVDEIAAETPRGGNPMQRATTRRAATLAINAHGEAVKVQTQTVKTSISTFMSMNNVVEIPQPPSTPPPPLPPPRRPQATGSGLLAPPASPPPTRKDMRPSRNDSGRQVRFKEPSGR